MNSARTEVKVMKLLIHLPNAAKISGKNKHVFFTQYYNVCCFT